MTSKVTVLTPTDKSEAVELSRTMWRKKILPVGDLPYEGRVLNFTRKYLDNVVSAFKEKAYDSVPLQLAPDDNSHTNAVERSAGEIVGLEATDEGLYATISATEKGSQILSDFPNLPVSVKLREQYQRNDGKSSKVYPAALAHVLATWGPRVSGLGPWQAIALSDDEGTPVIDLSALTFTPEGDIKQEQASAESGEETPGKELVDMPPLSQEQQDTLKTLFTQWQEEASAASTETPETAPQPPVFQEVEVVEAPEAAQESEQLEAIAASEESSDGAVELAEIELATKVDRLEIQLAEVKAREDAANWKLEFSALVSEKGLSPAIVNLAEPLLKGSKHTVELSEGTTVDAGQVMRTVLDAVAKTYGKAVDLSAPVGSAHDGAAGDTEAQERAAFLASQRNFVK